MFQGMVNDLTRSGIMNRNYQMRHLVLAVLIFLAFVLSPEVNGQDWEVSNGPPVGLEVQDIVQTSTGRLFAGVNILGSSTQYGVYISDDDGQSWEFSLQGERIWSMARGGDDVVFAGTVGEGVFRSVNNGNSWEKTSLEDAGGRNVRSMHVTSGGAVFAGSNDGRLFVSNDSGISWNEYSTSIPFTSDIQAISSTQGSVLIGGTGGIYRSVNGGASWQTVVTSSITCYGLSPATNQILYAACGGDLYLSIDSGNSWSQKGALGSLGRRIRVNEYGHVFITTSVWVYASADQGQTLIQVEDGITNSSIVGLLVDDDGHLFIGGNSGVQRSTVQSQSLFGPELVGPADGISDVAINEIEFEFNSTSISTYEVQVSKTPGFSAIEDFTIVGSSRSSTQIGSQVQASYSITITGLVSETTYYWRISHPSTQTFSRTRSFTTVSRPATPVLSSPEAGSTTTLPLTLSWGAVSPVDSYDVQVSSATDFSVLSMDASGIASTGAQATGMLPDNQYYWRVRARRGGALGDWSTARTVIIQISPPVPNSPSTGSSDVTVNPTLTWQSSQGASNYQYNLSEDQNFSSIVESGSVSGATAIEVNSTLAYDSQYFWRVRAVGNVTTSEWSSVFSFRTKANSSPNASFAASNSGGVVPLVVNFDASGSNDPDGDALTYAWDFGDGSTGAGVTVSHTYATIGTYTVVLTVSDGLLADSQSAQVVVTPANSAPSAAITASGTLGQAPYQVSLDASGSSDPDGDSLTYNWDFGDGTGDSGASVSHIYTTGGSFTVTLTVSDGSLSDSETLVITVSAPNVAPVASFTSSSASGQAPFEMTFDASGSSDPNGDALTYAWEFGDGSTGSGAIVSHEFTFAGTFTITLEVSDGALNSTATTQVTIASGVNTEESELPAGLELNSAYPNPFNPSTVISFALPRAESVSLWVVDMSGRIVSNLIAGKTLSAGNHEVTFDASGLPSGNYLVSIRTGDQILTKGITLLK